MRKSEKKVVLPLSESEGNQKEFVSMVFSNELCKQKLPICFPFIIRHSHWERDAFHIHHYQSMTTIEIILEGVMAYEFEEEIFTVNKNQMILLPVGSSNKVRGGSSQSCRKVAFGVHGPLGEIILAHLGLYGGCVYSLTDVSKIIGKLGDLAAFYDEKNIMNHLSELTGGAFEILYLLREQIPKPSAGDLLQQMQINMDRHISIDEFAKRIGVPRRKVTARFKDSCGKAPIHYLIWQRMQIARQLLGETELGIKEIATQTGYASLVRFDHAFKAEHGISPREFRRRAKKTTPAEQSFPSEPEE